MTRHAPLSRDHQLDIAPSPHTVISAQFGTNEYYQVAGDCVLNLQPHSVGLPAYMDQKAPSRRLRITPASGPGTQPSRQRDVRLGLQAPTRKPELSSNRHVTEILGSHTPGSI
jgi:hypothetical protein